MLNLDKLTKVLMLTQSPVDGESLAACRTANAMLAKAGMNWAQFFAAYVPEDAVSQCSAVEEDDFDAFAADFQRKQPWRKSARGNWTRYSGRRKGLVTVFRDSRGFGWKWVCNNEFYGPFASAESAMANAGKD